MWFIFCQDAHKFGATLAQSLNDMRDLFSKD